MQGEIIQTEIKNMLAHMGFQGSEVEAYGGAASRFGVRLQQEARMLIGEHGNNLSAFEYLLKRILRNKTGEDHKFTLDINDYRMRKLEVLKQDVKNATRAVRAYKKEIPLRPMGAFERRIVHLLLAEYPDIITESIGQGIDRKVVIKPYP